MLKAYFESAGIRRVTALVGLTLPLLLAACSSDSGGTTGSGGTGNRGGSAGSGSNTGGSGGSTGGTGGSTGGTGGSTGGSGGSTGGTGGSTGGTGGTGGAVDGGGKSGSGGTGGNTGGTAGTGGTSGSGGSAGTADGGSTGGTAGTGGSAGSGGSDGGMPDGGGTGGTGGGTGDGGVVVVPPGDPISVPDMTWKAVPTTGAICRDKSATGFAVNFNAASDKLIIYMEGGGACFNGATCLSNSGAMTWAATDTEAAKAGSRFILNRSSANNPFKDWNLVYIPYCTGDVHTGTSMSGYDGAPQMGYSNYLKYLGKLVATFKSKSLSKIVLSGSSAGGFGTAWNWMVTEDAFGAPVYAIDDSGPPFATDWLTTCHQQRTGMLWGWSGSVHPACTNCDVSGGNVVIPLMEAAMKRQKKRFGLLSYDEDGTIKTFLAYGLNNCANWNNPLPTFPGGQFPIALADLRTRWMSYPNAAEYVVGGTQHTFLGMDFSNAKTGNNITMLEWVTKLINDETGWTNVYP